MGIFIGVIIFAIFVCYIYWLSNQEDDENIVEDIKEENILICPKCSAINTNRDYCDNCGSYLLEKSYIEVSDKKIKYEEKEKQEVKKMSEDMRKAFYEFKENFPKNFMNELKTKDNTGLTEEDLDKMKHKFEEEIDYVEFFNLIKKQAETQEALKILIENCMIYEDIHNIAYSLNTEYKILWDNLSEETKKPILKARKQNKIVDNINKVRWGLGTFGISTIGSKVLEGRKNNKIEDYVTNEGFTALCVIINTNNNYYKEDNKE